MNSGAAASGSVAQLEAVSLSYGNCQALQDISLTIPAASKVGFIGPDGVGKSSLLALIAGARKIQSGSIHVLGGDLANPAHRRALCPSIAYMPQGLGKNLYPTLTVYENIDFFGRLFGHRGAERRSRIDSLTRATGLEDFLQRPAKKLSGGMKQKLGLCCALIHDPDLLILDEPTTGVDPLSRRQFWHLIDAICKERPAMSVLVATAYMAETDDCDWLVAMDEGRVLAEGTPAELLAQCQVDTLDDAFVALLPETKRGAYQDLNIPALEINREQAMAIEAKALSLRFGDFTAVDKASFSIRRGEIFGFVGSNGCGKTTTMKMLTGLLRPSEGQAWIFGRELDAKDSIHDSATRLRVGYMSQSFSLYTELTVRQNLALHARLFQMDEKAIPARIDDVARRFSLTDLLDSLPDALPLGHRQRLSLAVAMIHGPELLILDEPTSGVDPIARDDFWRILVTLSRQDGVTIFISTHFMNEAENCDRIALMHAGRVLATDTPEALIASRRVDNLEEAFIEYLCEAGAGGDKNLRSTGPAPGGESDTTQGIDKPSRFESSAAGEMQKPNRQAGHSLARSLDSLRRTVSYANRETLELKRDPVRMTLAILGSVLLLFVMAYGMSMDVNNLRFAVLDRDQTALSRDYVMNLSGSGYFEQLPAIEDYRDLDRRMIEGELGLAIEIPYGFARDIASGAASVKPIAIAAWVDGAMPSRGETLVGYAEGMHQQWLLSQARREGYASLQSASFDLQTRYRYNPDVKSMVAMAPAITALLLMMIPAMLSALSVVREKELGSIINFYVTPTSRLEFILGKQLPYIILSMLSCLVLVTFTTSVLAVPFTGSVVTLMVGALLYVAAASAMGLLISTFMRSQVAAVFGTTILTVLPAQSFSGLIDPVPSLEGVGRFIGEIYPTTHFLTIIRGTFSKALGFDALTHALLALACAVPVLLVLTVLCLQKQEK